MAESTLSLDYDDLRSEIGFLLGYGLGTSPVWSTAQAAAITACLNSGLRQFYVQQDWEWSFLKPISTIILWADVALDDDVTVTATYSDPTVTITASEAIFHPAMVGADIVITDVATLTIVSYTSTTVVTATSASSVTGTDKTFSISSDGVMGLPDDCADIEGRMTFEPNQSYHPVISWPEARLRSRRQLDSASTGPPQYYAKRPRAYTPATGERWDIMVWPIPDEDYTMTYRKVVNLDALTANQYPPGGLRHSETILASCRSAAELRLDDNEGPQKAKYEELLAKSKEVDARTGPETLGQNMDSTRGGRLANRYVDRHDGHYVVTYDGSL